MSKNPNDKTIMVGDWKIEYLDSRHIYFATDPKTGERFKVPSASQVTKVMDLDKSGRLMGWAVKQGAEALREAMQKVKGGEVKLDGPRIQGYMDIVTKAHRKRVDKAADRGKEVHAWCENFCEGAMRGNATSDVMELLFNDSTLPRAEKEFLRWFSMHKVEPIDTESIVFHPEYEYAGTFDLFCTLDYQGKRRTAVIDFKTSNYTYKEHEAQVACYMEAVPHRWPHGDKPDLGCILMLDQKGKPNYEAIWIEGERKDEAWGAFLAARSIYAWGK